VIDYAYRVIYIRFIGTHTQYDKIDDFLEGKLVDPEITKHLVEIFEKTQHKRAPIPTIYD
jgi:NH3-dependent NAD+ synthetase